METNKLRILVSFNFMRILAQDLGKSNAMSLLQNILIGNGVK
jgi:hypothetical protein